VIKRPLNLTQQNALRLMLVFIAFELIAAAAVMSLLVLPMSRRAAGDFGELLAMSAEIWSELPPMTRPAFERHLVQEHGILLADSPPTDELQEAHHGTYLRQLERTLAEHFSRPLPVLSSWRGGEEWHWVALPGGERRLWLGFPHSRVGTQPVATMVLTFGAGIIMAILAAWWLARRTIAPLRKLDQAAAALGRGEKPDLLPETGPRELAELARTVNLLAKQVDDLLDGRTTLLAGLSHDLRTPLSRMRLALEMLQRKPDPKWVAMLEADIEQMNRLVGEMLELARGLGREEAATIDVPAFIEGLAQRAREEGAIVETVADSCTVNAPPVALRRLLDNLVSNARRYGGAGALRLEAHRAAGALRVGVLDRGPGIPDDQLEAVFRPFHRVESSRSSATGGSGLGLAIVRQLAQANGWQVRLENRQDGGLAAWVELPMGMQQAS
jgi:two-component system, OmpR family, osmolarity sensor histidine kinase EnvZ